MCGPTRTAALRLRRGPHTRAACRCARRRTESSRREGLQPASRGSQLPPGSHPSRLAPPEPQLRGPIAGRPKEPGRSPTQSTHASPKDLRRAQPQGWPARGSRPCKRTGPILTDRCHRGPATEAWSCLHQTVHSQHPREQGFLNRKDAVCPQVPPRPPPEAGRPSLCPNPRPC